ncbi:MAG: sigma-54 dependent transcriptional regulator, partial [Desulfobulbaceae bacterium]|nr:sigma-54 dependent transcriptional regulator [Desulfobulbaceae bacterium]
MPHVLIIDDDPAICKFMERALAKMAYHTSTAHTLSDGMAYVEQGGVDVVFLDVNLPDGDGLSILPALRQTDCNPEVVIFTGAGCPNGAEAAITNGAWDYLNKPVSPQQLTLCMKRILLYRKNKQQTLCPSIVLRRHGIIGSSPQINECRNALARASHSDASVLVTGETGTGKELFARAIHANGKRQDKNFVVVDCAALPENLIESALFGHERGAFTGADRTKIGLVKQAHGGTLFLDEIGELPLSLQKTFLRVLQEQRFRPVGGNQEVHSDFRLVAATHCDLEKMVSDGRFRQDLFYRIRSITLELPPLRIRQNDIVELARHFLKRICEKYGLPDKKFAGDAEESLVAYLWPGNVRELSNAIESAVSSALNEPIIFAKHLPQTIRVQIKKESMPVAPLSKEPVGGTNSLSTPPPTSLPTYRQFKDKALAEAEKQYLEQLL